MATADVQDNYKKTWDIVTVLTDAALQIFGEAKQLAPQYRALMGKLLGITGEVAECKVARLLGVQLMPDQHASYDAVERRDGRAFLGTSCHG